MENMAKHWQETLFPQQRFAQGFKPFELSSFRVKPLPRPNYTHSKKHNLESSS